MNKLLNNKTVTSETLMKICVALGCTFDDIMEIIVTENGDE
ncbi:MAG: helix-turn-helix transcriptional regulator [Roseburia sp.]|nr:helix-turn-helix transcriptional regulator [Roseburia sp.]